MYNTYITSSLTFRARASLPFSYHNDYSYASAERCPFAYSSSRTSCCCSCCASSVYRMSISPCYTSDLYGCRQSSLIQCRKLSLSRIDRDYYSRVSGSDVDRRCVIDRGQRFREKSVKRGGLQKRMVIEERSESYDDIGDMDETEAILSLLAEDVGEECFRERKERKRVVKKPVVEKREEVGVCGECRSRKKRNGVGVLESGEYELVIRKRGDRRSERSDNELVIRKQGDRRSEVFDEKRQGLSRRENRNVREMDEEEEEEEVVRKPRRKKEVVCDDVSQSLSRKKVSSASVREEEKEEDLRRREEHRHRMRKDGSSCSSYYSFSSNGDYENENEIDLRERRITEESLNERENIVRSEIDRQEAGEKYQRLEDFREEAGTSLTKKTNVQETHVGSSVLGSEFRKKSEKKLIDESVEVVHRKGTKEMESELSMVQESGYGKSSKSYAEYDDRRVISGGGHMVGSEQQLLNKRTGVEISSQSESKMKYKHSGETTHTGSDVLKTSYASQQIKGGTNENSAKETSSSSQTAIGLSNREDSIQRYSTSYASQQVKGGTGQNYAKAASSSSQAAVRISNKEDEIQRYSTSYASQQIKEDMNQNYGKAVSSSSQTAVGLSNREDEVQRYSQKATLVSDTIDIDVRKTSISLHETETSMKKMEDHSTIISSSTYDAEKNHHQDEVRGQVVATGKSQQLTIRDDNSSLNMQSDNQLMEQREKMNLSYGSYLDSEKRKSQSEAYFIKRDDSNRTDELSETSVRHSGDSSAIVVLENDEMEPGTLVRGQSSQLGPISAPSAGTSGSTTDKASDENLHSDLTAVHRSHLGRSTAIQHEDAIGSAARLQESSEHYVGKFVDNVRHEIMSSETQKEKRTYKSALVNEEEERKSLIENTSVDSESKEHDERRVSQGSGVKGPSVEMWKVDESTTGEQSTSVIEDGENKGDNAIVKRTGRTLWNVIGDVLRLRWSPRSESHSTGGKSGGKSSPIQSAGSETWFSGHEAEEKEEATGKKESAVMTQEFVSEIHQEEEEKIHSQFEEGSSSSTVVGHPTHAGINAPSSSVALQSGSATTGIHLPPTVGTSRIDTGATSSASEFQLRKSPVIRSESASASEGGEANQSDGGTSEQLTSCGSGEQSGPAADVAEAAEQRRKGKLRRKDQIVRDRFDEWEEAYMIEAEQRKFDEIFMREALLEAQKAGDNWEVPVGAVLVHNGEIIARGYNLVEELRDSTAHAEMICIREASNSLRTWRLSDTTLYVTLEPCPMCAGAILQARIDTIVWGAPNKLLGADGSWIRLFPNGDGGNSLEQSDKPAAPVHPFHPKITIRRGVLASECADTMKQFFQLRRKKKTTKPDTPPPSARVSISQHPSKFLKRMQHAFNIMFCM